MNAPLDTRQFTAQVKNHAAGQWHSILQALGVPHATLTKRNKPCPACGGTDRFSFIDDGRGAFTCRSLDRQGGDGFALVQHLNGCGFIDAVKTVANALGMAYQQDKWTPPPPRPQLAATPAPPVKDNTSRLAETWNKADPIRPLRPAGQYLNSRGLPQCDSKSLRFTPLLPYWNESVLLGKYPAMLARVDSPAGQLVALQRIYLTQAGRKADLTDGNGKRLACKKLATVRENATRGAAVRLYPIGQDGKLALTEGIETGLAVNLMTALPVWACVSAFGLEHVVLPEEAREVWIFADNDASETGQRAAQRLARRLRQEGRNVRVRIPSTAGQDWLDVLNQSTTNQPEAAAA